MSMKSTGKRSNDAITAGKADTANTQVNLVTVPP